MVQKTRCFSIISVIESDSAYCVGLLNGYLTFVRNREQLLTRQQILNNMWDSAGDFVNDNTLTVYVKRLRKKLEQEGDEPVIQTVRGMGYRMV